jgi:hypothetical protein
MGPLTGLRVVDSPPPGPVRWRPAPWRVPRRRGRPRGERRAARLLASTWSGLQPLSLSARRQGERPWNRVAQFNSQNVNKLSLTLDLKLAGART